MTSHQKKEIIEIIIQREKLRSISRLQRFLRDPFRAFPFYILAAFGHIKPYPLTFKTLWGTTMTCYFPEGNTFYYYGYCEANLTNYFLHNIKPGCVFLDVGAHVGFYTMLSSDLVGSNGQVHSFEPTPWTFGLLKKNTIGLSNVTLNNVAASDSSGMISFSDYGPGYGAFNSAHPKGASAFIKRKAITVDAPTISIDNYCEKKGIKPDIIKLDAEGIEHIILQGMTRILSDSKRPIITLEVAGGKRWFENTKKSFDLLLAHGYKAYEITNDGSVVPHTLRDSYEYDNLLFK